jgi:hypothetical protein
VKKHQLFLIAPSDYAWVVLDDGERIRVATGAYADQCRPVKMLLIAAETLAAAGIECEPPKRADFGRFFEQANPGMGSDAWGFEELFCESEGDLLRTMAAQKPDALRTLLRRGAVQIEIEDESLI